MLAGDQRSHVNIWAYALIGINLLAATACDEREYHGEEILDERRAQLEIQPLEPVAHDGEIDEACAEALEHSDFDWIHREILIPSCTGSAACHEGTSQAEDVNLLPGYAYEALLDTSDQRPELLLVHPGEPHNSYLMIKFGVYGTEHMEEDLMPPPPTPMICQEKIDAIRRWIEEGAQFN